MSGYVLVLAFCLFTVASCSNVNNDTALTGVVLKRMGKMYGNPLLRLLGAAFEDIEASLKEKIEEMGIEQLEGDYVGNVTFMNHVCQVLKCGRWSEWSRCKTGDFEFSMTMRIRQCGVDNDLCKYPAGDKRNETQSKVCTKESGKIKCPANFDMVQGQYCLRYVGVTEVKSSAIRTCGNDDGHVIHVDSAAKSIALHNYLESKGVSTSRTVWLNGMRAYSSGTFEYTYGDREPLFDNWYGGEPSSGSDELCKVDEGSGGQRFWWDRACDGQYVFVCEIV